MLDFLGLTSAWEWLVTFWNDPFWWWLNWYLTIVTIAIPIHIFWAPARIITGPIILAPTLWLFGYIKGRWDTRSADREAARTAHQRQNQQNQGGWRW